MWCWRSNQSVMSTRQVFYQQTSLLPSLGMFREINVVNEQHQRRQKSGLIKWLSRENLLVNKSWGLYPNSTWWKGSKRSHKLLSSTDTPPSTPQRHSKCNFKNWKPSVRETPRAWAHPPKCGNWEASRIWKWTAIKASGSREIEIMEE